MMMEWPKEVGGSQEHHWVCNLYVLQLQRNGVCRSRSYVHSIVYS